MTKGEDDQKLSDNAYRPPAPLREGCPEHWSWNKRDKSHKVRIYGPRHHIAHFHPKKSNGTAGVRGTIALNHGTHYWEIHITHRIFGTSMMFGIASKSVRLHVDAFTNLLGEDDQSWGLSHKGLLWHNGRWSQYTKAFRENESTTIGLLVDWSQGTLTYYKDGVSLGVAFTGINRVQENVFPVVCSTATSTKMMLGVTLRGFTNLQDRCRAVITRHVEDLDKLDQKLSDNAYRPLVPLRAGCPEHWYWNKQDKSHKVRIYGPRHHIAHFHPKRSNGTAGVRGTIALNHGTHYWEIHITHRIFGTSMMFGMASKSARLHVDAFANLLGEDDQSWGLSHKGRLWHNGRWCQYTNAFRENESTTIGLLVDWSQGTLTYYKDGISLGVAFTGINRVQENVFPVVCSTATKTKMMLGVTLRGFTSLQDRCRAVITRHIQDEQDLDKLPLPSSMKIYIGEAIPR